MFIYYLILNLLSYKLITADYILEFFLKKNIKIHLEI